MVLINKAINEVTVKLVYYGPGLCGKPTNLDKIYANPKLENKGKMISMATEPDRTLFSDCMPIELGTIGGQKVRVQLYTVPAQVAYDSTRKRARRPTSERSPASPRPQRELRSSLSAARPPRPQSRRIRSDRSPSLTSPTATHAHNSSPPSAAPGS